jgi:3',5'-nucleoside bisphosphate phosphatase
VSDHDNIDSYPVPDDLREKFIPGLEVDTAHDGHTTHMLAYGIDRKDCPLIEALARQRNAREQRMRSMIDRLQSLGLAVTLDDVKRHARATSSFGRPHLARALVERGYVASVQEAFDKYLADDGAGYIALERLDASRIVDLIHSSGGVAVIAHPVRLRKETHLEELLDLGVDGIEVWHPTADASTQARLHSLAQLRGLLVTGGTDFHAPVADRPIGIEIEERHIEELRSAISDARSRC